LTEARSFIIAIPASLGAGGDFSFLTVPDVHHILLFKGSWFHDLPSVKPFFSPPIPHMTKTDYP